MIIYFNIKHCEWLWQTSGKLQKFILRVEISHQSTSPTLRLVLLLLLSSFHVFLSFAYFDSMAFEWDVPKYHENNYAMNYLYYQYFLNIDTVLFSFCNSDHEKEVKINIQWKMVSAPSWRYCRTGFTGSLSSERIKQEQQKKEEW